MIQYLRNTILHNSHWPNVYIFVYDFGFKLLIRGEINVL